MIRTASARPGRTAERDPVPPVEPTIPIDVDRLIQHAGIVGVPLARYHRRPGRWTYYRDGQEVRAL